MAAAITTRDYYNKNISPQDPFYTRDAAPLMLESKGAQDLFPTNSPTHPLDQDNNNLIVITPSGHLICTSAPTIFRAIAYSLAKRVGNDFWSAW